MDTTPAGQPEPSAPRAAPAARSGEVRELVARLRAIHDPRAARLARARRLLLTGALDRPDVHRETARRLLGLGGAES